jgi:ATP-dependent protease ClpP protease subunit
MYHQMTSSYTPPQYTGPQVAPPNHFYFYDDIGDTKDYCDLVFTLDHAAPGDEIHLHLATGGGNMEAAIVIVHAILRTQATVIAHAEAGVASAGTIIMLACENIEIHPFAHFLYHDGSLTSPGMKFSDNLKQAQAIVELYAKLAYSIYVPFFTEDEVTRILKGEDFYVTSEDMAERVLRVLGGEDSVDDEGEEPGV